MSNKSKKIVLTVLIFSLAVAVYLNWQFPNEDFSSSASLENESKNLGDTRLVNATTSVATEEDTTTENNSENNQEKEEPTTEAEKTKKESASEKTNYFEDARKTRGKARDEALAILRETADNIKIDDNAKSKAIEEIAVIAANVECEANVENLIKAKGYSDAIVIITGEEMSIVVKDSELSSSQLAELQEIGVASGKVKSDKIKIITAN